MTDWSFWTCFGNLWKFSLFCCMPYLLARNTGWQNILGNIVQHHLCFNACDPFSLLSNLLMISPKYEYFSSHVKLSYGHLEMKYLYVILWAHQISIQEFILYVHTLYVHFCPFVFTLWLWVIYYKGAHIISVSRSIPSVAS